MAVPKRKWSKQRSRSLRANWKLSTPNLVECTECHELTLSHQVCKSCGHYAGKEVIAMEEE